MKKKKKVMIVIGGLLIFAAVGLIILGMLLGGEKEEKAKDNNTDLEKYDKLLGAKLDDLQRKGIDLAYKFNDYLIDPTKDNEDYGKLTSLPVNHFLPMVGEDAIQSVLLPDEYLKQIDKKEVNKYVKAQKKYNKNLEVAIKEIYDFRVKEVPLYTEDKKQLMVISEVKPFGYIKYRKDLVEISSELILLSGENIQEENARTVFTYYKSRVKAMEILNDNLEDYKNDKWIISNIIFDLGSKIKCSNCDLYINQAQGMTLDDVKFENNEDKYAINRDSRINNILNKAIENGTLNKKKPLELK